VQVLKEDKEKKEKLKEEEEDEEEDEEKVEKEQNEEGEEEGEEQFELQEAHAGFTTRGTTSIGQFFSEFFSSLAGLRWVRKTDTFTNAGRTIKFLMFSFNTSFMGTSIFKMVMMLIGFILVLLFIRRQIELRDEHRRHQSVVFPTFTTAELVSESIQNRPQFKINYSALTPADFKLLPKSEDEDVLIDPPFGVRGNTLEVRRGDGQLDYSARANFPLHPDRVNYYEVRLFKKLTTTR
jgi:hypothetical protein